MKLFGQVLKALLLGLCLVLIWLLSGHNEAAFRYLGF